MEVLPSAWEASWPAKTGTSERLNQDQGLTSHGRDANNEADYGKPGVVLLRFELPVRLRLRLLFPRARGRGAHLM